MVKFLSFVLLFLLFGCSVNDVSISSAREHMLESQRLNDLIHEIEMVMYEKSKSELQRDDTRRRYILELSDELEKLSRHIKKDSYSEYSHMLKKSSQELREIAKNYELENLPSVLNKAQNICSSCHNTYRD